MTENIGQIITRYTICQITCNAYTRAMPPANSQSSFRKTGIFPHNPSVISMQQLVPCESFRVENPVQRVELLKTERADCTTKDWNQAQCRGKSYNWRRLRQRNGRLYTKQSNAAASAYTGNTQSAKETRKLAKQAHMPKPSTSGLNVIHITYISSEEMNVDEELEEGEACWRAQKHSPPMLSKSSMLKKVYWA